MLELNNIDFNDTDDLKEIRKLKKSELLTLFKNPEVVKSLTKNQLLELLLENKFFLELKEKISSLQNENMKLKSEVNKLRKTDKASKYLELEAKYESLLKEYDKLSRDVNQEKRPLEEKINKLYKELAMVEEDRNRYRDLYQIHMRYCRKDSYTTNTNTTIDFNKYYRKLAMYLHPDKQNGDDEGMKILNELKDKLK